MKKYKFSLTLKYLEKYIPPRCRKPRTREATMILPLAVPSVTYNEAPVAFFLKDYESRTNGKQEIRRYHSRLYERVTESDLSCVRSNASVPADRLPNMKAYIGDHAYYSRSKEETVEDFMNEVKKYLVINGNLWRQCGEPRYVIMTFGLGHNHASTNLFVEKFYNPNISKNRYFSALEGDAAVREMDRVAAARGDTRSIGRARKMIDVLIPCAVSVKPRRQNGNGDPYMNEMEALIENSGSAVDAGLVVIASTLKKLA